MQVNPYLTFNDQCEEAFKFYESCLGGRIEAMLSNGASPMAAQVPAERHDKIMHARMTVGDSVLMGADAPPDRRDSSGGFSVCLSIPEPADAERVFRALSDKGTVQMPIAETFWAQRFGMVVDRFGIPWMVNCERQA